MVQVLPYIPSPLQQLSSSFAETAGDVGTLFGKLNRQKKDQDILSQIKEAKSKGGDISTLWRGLSPETRKIEQPFLDSYIRKDEAQAKANIKSQAAVQEKEQKKEGLRSVVADLEELKPYAGTTKNPLYLKTFNAQEGGLNRPGIQKRAEIDSLSITLEGALRDIATKGTLPKRTFEILLEKIPKSTDSERVYQGKLDAFKKILKSASPQAQEEIKKAISPESPPTERPPLESFLQ